MRKQCIGENQNAYDWSFATNQISGVVILTYHSSIRWINLSNKKSQQVEFPGDESLE